jgi:hypothetical protein
MTREQILPIRLTLDELRERARTEDRALVDLNLCYLSDPAGNGRSYREIPLGLAEVHRRWCTPASADLCRTRTLNQLAWQTTCNDGIRDQGGRGT